MSDLVESSGAAVSSMTKESQPSVHLHQESSLSGYEADGEGSHSPAVFDSPRRESSSSLLVVNSLDANAGPGGIDEVCSPFCTVQASPADLSEGTGDSSENHGEDVPPPPASDGDASSATSSPIIVFAEEAARPPPVLVANLRRRRIDVESEAEKRARMDL
ncbi:unnamed protein product [Urochloa humidicola]